MLCSMVRKKSTTLRSPHLWCKEQKMEKSLLATFVEKRLQERRALKKNWRNDPKLYREVMDSLSDRARFAHQHRMYQLSGAMNSRDLVRFDPHAHGVANGH